MEKQTLIRRIVLAALRHMGLGRIKEAVNLDQARAALSGGEVGLIVSSCDANNPAGRELFQLSRENEALGRPPFIALISAGAAPSQAMVDDPKAEHLTKPFAVDDLKSKVDRLLA